MDIIHIIGELLAKNMKLSSPAGRGLLKLAIKDQLGPFKPLEEIDYENMKEVISFSLKNRLINLGIENHNNIVTIILNELNRNQSLFTMTKV